LSTILQAEKESIKKYQICSGYIRRRGSFFRSWTEYYGILSGWYIYFYLSEKDLEYDHYISIKGAIVSKSYEEIGTPNSFKVIDVCILDKNREGDNLSAREVLQ
jgi:hypothetical protein